MTPEQHAAKIRELEAPMAAAYLAEVRAVESEATVAEVERLLRDGDSEGLVAYLSLGSMAAFLELFRAAFIQGANNEALGRFRFDSNTWAVINLLMGANQEIQATSDMDLRNSVAAVMGNGNTIRNQALDLIGVRSPLTGRRSGGVVGLPIQMTEWVQSARQQLLSGDRAAMRAYLTRKLRDTAFDKFVTPGQPLTISQANTIARAYADRLVRSYSKQLSETMAAQAYNSGRFQSVQQMVERGLVTMDQVSKKWRTMRDERVRHSHAVMNGQVQPLNGVFISGNGNALLYPADPNAPDDEVYNCFAPWTRIDTALLKAATCHDYSGDLIHISVGGENALSVTPNHPVLTNKGWIAAAEVAVGDQVIQCGLIDSSSVARHPNVENINPFVHQVYSASESLSGAKRVASSTMNFHGDVPAEDVNVVAVDSSLRRDTKSGFDEFLADLTLADSDVSAGTFLFDSAIERCDLTHSGSGEGSVSSPRPISALIFSEELCGEPVPLANIRGFNVSILEDSIDNSTANSEFLGDSKDWESVGEKVNGLILNRASLGFTNASRSRPLMGLKSKIEEAASNNWGANSNGIGNLALSQSILMKADNVSMVDGSLTEPMVEARIGTVVFVGRSHYSGPVYNFESESGVLVSDGIITHNCRCSLEYRISKRF